MSMINTWTPWQDLHYIESDFLFDIVDVDSVTLTVFVPSSPAPGNSSLNSRYFTLERHLSPPQSFLYLTFIMKDDKKSLADPSEFSKEDDSNEMSDSEGSDTPLCDSPPSLPAPPQVYAKSNAVKEQIQCKNGLNVNKKGNKPMTK